MARKSNPVPSYLHHKPSGRAFVRLPGPGGKLRYVYLGAYGSDKSRIEYARIVSELGLSPRPPAGRASSLSVNELLRLFQKQHVERHYRHADGTPTNEQRNFAHALRTVRELYGLTPAAQFGPLALKAVRQALIDAGICRTQINNRMGRIRRAFKWAASEELVPAAVHQALTTVAGLQAGRSAAKEREPVKPVPEDVVEATVPFLNRHVAGLVRFQMLTGCRPGEARGVRRRDIEMGGEVWLFRPPHHKSAWRGKSRVVAIGPRAQELLCKFFTPNLDDYLFSPRRAVAEFHAARSDSRETPRFPSHIRHNVNRRTGRGNLADSYSNSSYVGAIGRACRRAFPPEGELAQRPDESRAKWWKRLTAEQKAAVKAWNSGHRWHPNRLRHSFATFVRMTEGLEAAQVLLGHSRADVTQVYAARDEGLAVAVARRIG
jgi:integrase